MTSTDVFTDHPFARPAQDGSGPHTAAEAALLAVRSLARDRWAGVRLHNAASRLEGHAVDDVQQALQDELSDSVQRGIGRGWTPLDLYETTRRQRCGPSALRLLAHFIAVRTDNHSPVRVDPRWRAQVDALAAPASRPASVEAWARSSGMSWPDALEALIDLLSALTWLPKLQQVLAPPGGHLGPAAPGPIRSSGSSVHLKMVQRVRALLAKAESTEFAAEAETLTAKAQQLMTQYAIDSALTAATHADRLTPVVRRTWIDGPYVSAKASLLAAIARAHHCRTVTHRGWDFVTIVGHDSDLDIVEVLAASLLIQATRAMTAAGPRVACSGYNSTRSFRHAFLLAYADRIGRRLQHRAGEHEAAADVSSGGALLPVLASRARAVDDELAQRFPRLATSRASSVSNTDGWVAGRTAADLADLGVRRPLRSAG